MKKTGGVAIVATVVMLGACVGRTPLGTRSQDAGTTDAGDAGPPKLTTSNKADVLFAIDNSGSMRGRPIMVAALCADILA